MKDTELYQHLLGLQSPWFVERVELDTKAQRVSVFAEHRKDATFKCPECGTSCSLHDHDEERSWRHLDRYSRYRRKSEAAFSTSFLSSAFWISVQLSWSSQTRGPASTVHPPEDWLPAMRVSVFMF